MSKSYNAVKEKSRNNASELFKCVDWAKRTDFTGEADMIYVGGVVKDYYQRWETKDREFGKAVPQEIIECMSDNDISNNINNLSENRFYGTST